jgi:hypothetical protein
MAERKRTVVLTDDAAKNVKTVATYRLNNAVKSIGTFGQCFGSNYEWADDQIELAETALLKAVESTMENIRTGKKIAKAGIQL